MKVSRNMIAKDLRPSADFYKAVLGRPVKKGRTPVMKSRRRRSTDRTRQTFNEYLTREDGSKLRLLIKRPKPYKTNKKNVPCVLWIHGGGYATGMPEMLLMSQAKQLIGECLIVSPEYRLSLETPYPAALDDCWQALLWLRDHGAEFGGNINQIFVGGESAGGGLTAAVCLLARDRGTVKIACQMPLYPMIDDRGDSKSMKDNNAPIWSEKQNSNAWSLYLEGQKKITKYMAPARETDYSGLPPVITFVGNIEPFRDETVAYARALQKAGVPVHFKIYEGCYHAFDMMAPLSAEAKAASAFFRQSVQYAKKHYFAEQDC